MSFTITSYPVKGTYYYQQADYLLSALSNPQRVNLVEEYTNRFDDNAIQIWAFIKNKSCLIGYIPRSKTKHIHFLTAYSLIEYSQVSWRNNSKKLTIQIKHKKLFFPLIRYYWWLLSTTIWNKK